MDERLRSSQYTGSAGIRSVTAPTILLPSQDRDVIYKYAMICLMLSQFTRPSACS